MEQEKGIKKIGDELAKINYKLDKLIQELKKTRDMVQEENQLEEIKNNPQIGSSGTYSDDNNESEK